MFLSCSYLFKVIYNMCTSLIQCEFVDQAYTVTWPIYFVRCLFTILFSEYDDMEVKGS